MTETRIPLNREGQSEDSTLLVTSAQAFQAAQELLRSRRLPDAALQFCAAERLGFDPDACCSGRWMCNMLAGDFEAGWQESDAISRRETPDPNRFWTGESLEGSRVLIRCLHGLGDTIQFIRYAPLLRNFAKSVVIEAQPILKPLLEVSRLGDGVITWGEKEPDWDQQIEVIELPRIFRTTLDSVPGQVPYLQTRHLEPLEKDLPTRPFRVGLVWAGSAYDSSRSISLELLKPLLSVPGVQFASFQPDPDRQDLRRLDLPIPDLYEPPGSIVLAAEKLQSMDLVITVDTMMAHLAGSLALPCWTLLPFEADWRWLVGRSDSPWYPTMRLFRQKQQGRWEAVVAEMKQQLQVLVGNEAGGRL